MQTVKIDIRNYTTTGGVHANLIINGNDTGVLYLSPVERELLLALLRAGAAAGDRSEEVSVIEIDPEDEVDLDIFD